LHIGNSYFHRAMDKKSRMSREIHVRFCESLRGKFPWATRPSVETDTMKRQGLYALRDGWIKLHHAK